MKNLLKNIAIYGNTAIVSVLSVPAAFAALGLSDTLQADDVQGENLVENIMVFINYILTFIGIVALVLVIYAGFLILTAAGDEEALGKGKKILTYAAIGIVVVFLSYSIVNVLINSGSTTTNTTTSQ